MFFSSDPTDYEDLYALCSELEIGMSRSEVIAAMGGEPKEIQFWNRDTLTLEVWFYDNRMHLSTPLSCDFDSAGQTVIQILCGEHSRKFLNSNKESDSLGR